MSTRTNAVGGRPILMVCLAVFGPMTGPDRSRHHSSSRADVRAARGPGQRGSASRAAIIAWGSMVAGRSLTCPSPSSMIRHTPSVRSARSTVTNGRPSAAISGATGARSTLTGGESFGVSGCGPIRTHTPLTPPRTHLGGGERLKTTQYEPAPEVVLTQPQKPARHLPGSCTVVEFGDEHGLVPVVLHRLGVIPQYRWPRTQFDACPVKVRLVRTRGPYRRWSDRGQSGIPARQLMGLPVLFAVGAQHHATPGEHLGERGVLLTTQHPAAVHRHTDP